MSSVLFDNPGPRTRSRHRLYSLIAGLAMLGIVGLVLWRLGRTGQLEYDLWEVFVTPAYIQALLVDGLLRTLQMAFSSIILAVAFGMVFGLGKLSDHGWVRWPSWVIVEFFRAVPVLLMMIFIFFTYGAGEGGIGSYWSVVIALTLYNGSVLSAGVCARGLAGAQGQSEGGEAGGMREAEGVTSVVLPQAGEGTVAA